MIRVQDYLVFVKSMIILKETSFLDHEGKIILRDHIILPPVSTVIIEQTIEIKSNCEYSIESCSKNYCISATLKKHNY